MKSTLSRFPLLALAALAVVSFARADEPPAPPPPPPAGEHPPRLDPKKAREHRLQMLDEKLQLTADQKQKINAIWDKAEEQGRALRADESLSRDDRRAKAMELMKASRAEVRAVLTADQQKTFDAMPPERPMRRGPRPEGGEAPPPPPAK